MYTRTHFIFSCFLDAFVTHHVSCHVRRFSHVHKQVDLEPGGEEMASVAVSVEGLARASANGDLVSFPGAYTLVMSTGSTDLEITVNLTVTGVERVLESLPPGL